MSIDRLAVCAERINKRHKDYTLLDAGCRTMNLKPLLEGCREYSGTDLIPAEGVLQCDLDSGLSFENDAFDVVTALDVLEHLDKPHTALQELYRVARKTVLISLPNIYYVTFRTNFLRGRGLSGKYHFEPEPVVDRHRWVLSYDEALEFIYRNSEGHHVETDLILPDRGRTKMVSEPVEKWLAANWPNLFAYGILFEITLKKE